MKVTDEIRREHQRLLDGVHSLREAADAVGTESWEVAEDKAEQALAFLKTQLTPHAREEDEHLYPMVAAIMGAPEGTRTMSRDHVEVGRLTRQLEWALANGETATLRRLLYGLYHVIRLHLAKEEEIYLPLLERHEEGSPVPLAIGSHAG